MIYIECVCVCLCRRFKHSRVFKKRRVLYRCMCSLFAVSGIRDEHGKGMPEEYVNPLLKGESSESEVSIDNELELVWRERQDLQSSIESWQNMIRDSRCCFKDGQSQLEEIVNQYEEYKMRRRDEDHSQPESRDLDCVVFERKIQRLEEHVSNLHASCTSVEDAAGYYIRFERMKKEDRTSVPTSRYNVSINDDENFRMKMNKVHHYFNLTRQFDSNNMTDTE